MLITPYRTHRHVLALEPEVGKTNTAGGQKRLVIRCTVLNESKL